MTLAGFVVRNLTDDFFLRANAKLLFAVQGVLLGAAALRAALARGEGLDPIRRSMPPGARSGNGAEGSAVSTGIGATGAPAGGAYSGIQLPRRARTSASSAARSRSHHATICRTDVRARLARFARRRASGAWSAWSAPPRRAAPRRASRRGASPVNTIGTLSGSAPESRIMSRARSTIRTGSPMSSTRISPLAPLQAGLQQQLGRLRDRHEEARDLGMRDRHRPAAGDLLAEAGNDAAGAAEHVAEPDDHELRGRRWRALWQTISASRLIAPITEVGFTALSVETSTNFSTLRGDGGAREHPGAPGVVAHGRHAFVSSISGTCLYAAAWKIALGRSRSSTESTARRASRRRRCSPPAAAGMRRRAP